MEIQYGTSCEGEEGRFTSCPDSLTMQLQTGCISLSWPQSPSRKMWAVIRAPTEWSLYCLAIAPPLRVRPKPPAQPSEGGGSRTDRLKKDPCLSLISHGRERRLALLGSSCVLEHMAHSLFHPTIYPLSVWTVSRAWIQVLVPPLISWAG
jgi:hypothetical protein